MILMSPVKIVKQKAFVLLPVLMTAFLLAWLFLEVSKSYELSSFIELHKKNQQHAFTISRRVLEYASAHQVASCFVHDFDWQDDAFWQRLPEQCHIRGGGVFAIERFQEDGNELQESKVYYRLTCRGTMYGEKVILQTIKSLQSSGRLSWRSLT